MHSTIYTVAFIPYSPHLATVQCCQPFRSRGRKIHIYICVSMPCSTASKCMPLYFCLILHSSCPQFIGCTLHVLWTSSVKAPTQSQQDPAWKQNIKNPLLKKHPHTTSHWCANQKAKGTGLVCVCEGRFVARVFPSPPCSLLPIPSFPSSLFSRLCVVAAIKLYPTSVCNHSLGPQPALNLEGVGEGHSGVRRRGGVWTLRGREEGGE